jgi:hypothetical protein
MPFRPNGRRPDQAEMYLLILTTVYVRWTEKARAQFFNLKSDLGTERRIVLVNIFSGAIIIASLTDTVPLLFHRSCGKVCGKAALKSYKFLRILYF